MTQNTSVGYIPASQTPKTTSILIYDGTPTESDLTTYDEIYTTPALCFAALPAIINHAVTIKIRKADGAAYAAATLQRVVAGGSITIQGEYYYNNTVASAGSGTGKFNVIAAHSGLIQAGDKIFLLEYSGTVGSSAPSDGFIDTVASVDGTEVTLTTRTTDTFTTSWTYMIVRTETKEMLVNTTNSVTIRGLYFTPIVTYGVRIYDCANPLMQYNIIEGSVTSLLRIQNCIASSGLCDGIALKQTSTSANYRNLQLKEALMTFRKCLLESATSTSATYGGICNHEGGLLNLQFSIIRDYDTGTAYGAVLTYGNATFTKCLFDGVSETYKMGIAMQATSGGHITDSSCVFGSNITTQKSPANWAATTDGSYIS